MKNFNYKSRKGGMLVIVLVVTSLFIVISIGIIELSLLRQKVLKKQISKTQSLHIAEAGINYYRWHLAHDGTDYYDGTGSDPGPVGEPYGPYIYDYISPGGEVQGKFSLEITPPPSGSTIVGIKSVGWTLDNPYITRTIDVKYGMRSLAHYSYLTNSDIWLGPTESVRGEMHSNGGVRMDGSNDSLVTSSRSTYVYNTYPVCDFITCVAPCSCVLSDCICSGVWGAGANFDLWDSPVPNVDFNAITVDVAELYAQAAAPYGYLGHSGNDGYHVIFKSDGTYDLYEVTDLKPTLIQLNDDWDAWRSIAEEINSENFIDNNPIPTNGILYIEDNVWIEGVVNGRLTLVAARLPDNINKRRSIIINDNLTYLNRDETCVLGLIAQKDIKVPAHAPTDISIDAVMLAQNGRVFRNYYNPHVLKNSIEVYGGIISYKTWTWSWVDSGGILIDGYGTSTSIYDNNVSFSPPPLFPSTGEYEFMSWEEN
ncbi:MAG: hypothetical protein PF572_03700 [Patescibacteria group bacterium]|jgi:hypothetical protein|nr:hypothetical protein [Patescibacteria group bacterium]